MGNQFNSLAIFREARQRDDAWARLVFGVAYAGCSGSTERRVWAVAHDAGTLDSLDGVDSEDSLAATGLQPTTESAGSCG